MRIEYAPEAIRDLEEVERYISNNLNSPNAAKAVVERIVKSVSQLGDFPYSGSPVASRVTVPTDLRYLVCGEYVAVYSVSSNAVQIGRVFNRRQDFIAQILGTD